MTKALLVPYMEEPRVIHYKNYKDLQRLVGGYIDAASWVFDDKPNIYLNDEGKFTSVPNRAVYATAEDEGKVTWSGQVVHEGDLLDVIFGDFVCVGFDPETGDDMDITDEEIAKVIDRFGGEKSIWSGTREVFRQVERKRVSVNV